MPLIGHIVPGQAGPGRSFAGPRRAEHFRPVQSTTRHGNISGVTRGGGGPPRPRVTPSKGGDTWVKFNKSESDEQKSSVF